MEKANLTINDRPVVKAANEAAELRGEPAAAMQLKDGRIVIGKTSDLLGASSAMMINALKIIAGIDDDIKLISPEFIDAVQRLKVDRLGGHNPRLHIEEMLIALTICAETDSNTQKALDVLDELRGCEVHSSVILASVDESTFKKLGMHLTCEPHYETKLLYHK